MKEVKVSVFFEWYFSDENSEGINISYYQIINLVLFDRLQQLFNDCVVVPKRLVERDDSNGGDYRVNVEVILVKD
jgi:hypothetical protein